MIPTARRNKRRRAFEGFSLKNADRLDQPIPKKVADVMTLEKPVPIAAFKRDRDVVMSSRDSDPAFTKIRKQWADEVKQDYKQQTLVKLAKEQEHTRLLGDWTAEELHDESQSQFQDYSFVDESSGKVGRSVYDDFSGTGEAPGFAVMQVKGCDYGRKCRKNAPWWIKAPHLQGTIKAAFGETNYGLLRDFYVGYMTDEDLFEENKKIFEFESNGKISEYEIDGKILEYVTQDKSLGRYTSSSEAVKKRRLALAKRGDELWGKSNPHKDKKWSHEAHLDYMVEIREEGGPPEPQLPGWVEPQKVVPPGSSVLVCSIPGCPGSCITDRPITPESRYFCPRHPSKIVKKFAKDNPIVSSDLRDKK